MAMQIDPARIKEQKLTYAEALYLKRRGRLPVGYPMPSAPKGDAGEPEPAPTKVTPLEEQSIPTIGDKGGILSPKEGEEEEEDYLEGWNNNQRRAELSKRGLSVEGGKADLIARLRRSDTDTLLADDHSTLND